MRFLKALITIFFFIGIFNVTAIAQHKKNSVDEVYEKYGYKSAIALYESKGNMSLEDMTKIANAYRLNHDTENAELWYSQIMDLTDEPIHYLYFAQALQSNGKFEQAKKYFLKYDHIANEGEGSDHRGELLAAAIDRMNDFEHSQALVENVALLNSEKLEFSPTFYKNGIVFVSTRQGENNQGRKDNWTDDNFMALYFSDKNVNGKLKEAEEFFLFESTDYHEGPVSFTKNGSRMFFTINDEKSNKKKNNIITRTMEIYSSVKLTHGWSKPVAFTYNTPYYDETHPMISPDGMKLFFASNRPGGFGGMDVYQSEFKQGKWTEPVNLGESINTPGNEVFPFIHDDGTLYFASDGWGGLGGLDVFSSNVTDKNKWGHADNMGTPFNSTKDDFGLIMNVLKTEGYLTSARDGGFGKDDIYSFNLPQNLSTKLNICAYDEETGERLSNINVQLTERPKIQFTVNVGKSSMIDKKDSEHSLFGSNDIIDIHKTDVNGIFETFLREDKTYKLSIVESGYQEVEQIIDLDLLKKEGKEEFCISLKKEKKCLSVDGQVKHQKYGTTIPEATVTLVNLCTGEETSVSSNNKGYFFFPCVQCECDYILKGSKNNFSKNSINLNTVKENCQLGSTIFNTIELDNDQKQLAGSNTQILNGNQPAYANSNSVSNSISTSSATSSANANAGANANAKAQISSSANAPIAGGIPKTENETAPISAFGKEYLEVGAVIELENIYYDFAKYYIRQDAKEGLNEVVELMFKYPSMVIELSSHTDCRASDGYNQRLSQNRAYAAVQYIASRGIDKSRLVAKGYGESRLRNHCSDGVSCSEFEHQRNRRTEIKILALNNSAVKVNYIDNLPETIDHPGNN